MPQFNLRKPNGSPWELDKPGQGEWYNKCREFIGTGTKLAGIIHIPDLVQLIQDFGGEKTYWGIQRMRGLGYSSLDSLQGLLEGSIPPERQIAPVSPKASQTTVKRPPATYQKPTPEQQAEWIPPPDWFKAEMEKLGNKLSAPKDL